MRVAFCLNGMTQLQVNVSLSLDDEVLVSVLIGLTLLGDPKKSPMGTQMV